MGKVISHLKVHLMNSIAIKLHVENPKSILVYAEGRFIREQILKVFSPDLINSELWFHILKFISPKLPPKPKNIGESLKVTHRKFWKEALFTQYDKKKCQTSFGYHPNEVLLWWKTNPPFNNLYWY